MRLVYLVKWFWFLSHIYAHIIHFISVYDKTAKFTDVYCTSLDIKTSSCPESLILDFIVFFIEAFTRLLQSSEVHISIKCLNLLPPAWFIGWVLLWLRLETLGDGRVCQPECILDAAACILRYYQFSWCLQKHCIIQLIACNSTIYKTQIVSLIQENRKLCMLAVRWMSCASVFHALSKMAQGSTLFLSWRNFKKKLLLLWF